MYFAMDTYKHKILTGISPYVVGTDLGVDTAKVRT